LPHLLAFDGSDRQTLVHALLDVLDPPVIDIEQEGFGPGGEDLDLGGALGQSDA
jgi:hypothetical protein